MSAATAYTIARVVALMCLPSHAGPAFCAERAQIAERLESRYSEQLMAGGLQSQDGIIEVWTQPDGETWTILLTHPDGVSCVMATGTMWYTQAPKTGTLN
jgi:hypothetical protein